MKISTFEWWRPTNSDSTDLTMNHGQLKAIPRLSVLPTHTGSEWKTNAGILMLASNSTYYITDRYGLARTNTLSVETRVREMCSWKSFGTVSDRQPFVF